MSLQLQKQLLLGPTDVKVTLLCQPQKLSMLQHVQLLRKPFGYDNFLVAWVYHKLLQHPYIVTNKMPFDWSRTWNSIVGPTISNCNIISFVNNMLQMRLIWFTLHLWTNWLTCLWNHLLLIRFDTFASSWELFLSLLYPSMLEVEVHMFHVLHIESIYKWCTHFISCMNEWECC